MTRRGVHVVAAAALLLSALLVALLAATESVRAQAAGNLKVVVVEVDGLESKDLRKETTPVMWEMMHPDQSTNFVGSGRAGFGWKMARGVMSSGTASAAASLLTGGYPKQTGIPGDEFFDATQGGPPLVRLGDPGASTAQELDASIHLGAQSMFELISSQRPQMKTGAFIGDPALAGLTTGDAGISFKPSNAPTEPSTPAYCPIPRTTADAQKMGTDFSSGKPPVCPTSDLVTLNAAFNRLNGAQAAGGVDFSYIHLAELGKIKRLVSDVDRPAILEKPGQPLDLVNPETGVETVDTLAVPAALALTDTAIGTFLQLYRTGAVTGPLYGDTLFVVVGNHGYEPTPITHRVPGGGMETDATLDLTDLVKKASNNEAKVAQQGTLATVYYTGTSTDPATRRSVMDGVRGKLLGVNKNPICAAAGDCIAEVLYTAPDPATGNDEETVQRKHPTWNLDHIDPKTKQPTGTGGDLIVVMKKGWAAGCALPLPPAGGDPLDLCEISTPYLATSGGPRNRAIAALVSGSSRIVKQVEGDYHGPEGDPNVLNANPGDDADTPESPNEAHKEQAETVDFVPTIGALLQVGVPQAQYAGRLLQEAFKIKLEDFVEAEELEEAVPDELPPPEPVNTVTQEEGFNYHGLVRDLKARVLKQPKKGVKLGKLYSHVELSGDFGRPQTQIVLTFYRQQGGAKRKKVKRGRGRKANAHTSRVRRKVELEATLLDQEGNGLGSEFEELDEPAGPARARKRSGRPAAAAARRRRGRSGQRRRVRIKTLARFKPFRVERGHVEMTLRVPRKLRPTHIGISVQEVKSAVVASGKGKKRRKPKLAFQGIGPKGGRVVFVIDNKLLHKRRPGKAKAQRPKGRKR